MASWPKKSKKNAEELKIAAAIQIFAVATVATPKDTGAAQASWFINLNAPAKGFFTPENIPQSASSASTAAKAKINAAKARDDIHITNNTPYINKLNEGSSAQAPAGFIENAVAAGIEQVKQAKIVKTKL